MPECDANARDATVEQANPFTSRARGGRWTVRCTSVTAVCLAWATVCLIYGAVPFVFLPTLGQMLWSSGFALSFVNAGWPAVTVQNFGLPGEAAMAFGLPGAVLQSTIIHLTGLNAADAYTIGIALWLALALYGGCRLGRACGLSIVQGAILSVVYLSLPIVWWHARYSYLSIGFALLPLYLSTAAMVTVMPSARSAPQYVRVATSFGYVATAVLAVFIDGYTFIMFAAMSGLLWLTALLAGSQPRAQLFLVATPTIVIGLGTAYLLYDTFIGGLPQWEVPLSFHRGWGLDLATLVVPSEDAMWLWDTIGLSVPRTRTAFYGDDSSWNTNFALSFIIVALLAASCVHKRSFVAGLFGLALLGLYLSLGPSLKIQSTRTREDIEARGYGELMPAEVALGPTGSGVMYAMLPGLKSMRATYRWIALTYVSLFGVMLLGGATLFSRGRGVYVYTSGAILFAMNIPDIPNHFKSKKNVYDAFWMMEADILPDLNEYVKNDEMVAFLPPSNDFLAAYMAARLDFRTYNIGGDKNLTIAHATWPPTMSSFPLGEADACLSLRVQAVLLNGDADIVIVPFIDLLWDAHDWPPEPKELRQRRDRYRALLRTLRQSSTVETVETPYFYAVEAAANRDIDALHPMAVVDAFCHAIASEWSGTAVSAAWSPGGLSLGLPAPALAQRCCSARCTLDVRIAAETASPEHPVVVTAEADGSVLRQWFHASSAPRVDTLRVAEMLPVNVDGYIDLELKTAPHGIGHTAESDPAATQPLLSVDDVATNCRRWRSDSQAVQTLVGMIKGGLLQTTGRSGFLMYGPYTDLELGKYLLTLEAERFDESGQSWLDISAERGQRQLRRMDLAEMLGEPSSSATVLQIPFRLKQPADDLEVRIWVDEAAAIGVAGYSIERVGLVRQESNTREPRSD